MRVEKREYRKERVEKRESRRSAIREGERVENREGVLVGKKCE